jgi:hypothetical protein
MGGAGTFVGISRDGGCSGHGGFGKVHVRMYTESGMYLGAGLEIIARNSAISAAQTRSRPYF